MLVMDYHEPQCPRVLGTCAIEKCANYALVRSCASVSNWVATWPSSVLFDSPFPRYISAWSITFRKNCSCATSSEDGPRARH